MDFELTKEIKAIRKEARRFARQEVRPRINEDLFTVSGATASN